MSIMQSPALTVVIPMYNCEEYVHDLLQSLSQQTFTDFEVICVNDGSTDNTLSIVESFCKNDARFRFISKENGGAGTARNAGIDEARGKYMMFLDSDDEFFPNLFEEMYETAEKHRADEVFCLCEEINCKTGTIKSCGFKKNILPPDTLVATESIEELYLTVSGGPWNALYRKDLIDRYQLRFSSTMVGNDMFFIYAYASVTKNIIGIHKELLRVRRYHNSESLTSGRWAHTEDVVSALDQLYLWLNEQQLAPKLAEHCRRLFIIALKYNASFPYNDSFIKAYAAYLCEGAMWKDIDDTIFYKNYWKTYDTEKIKSELDELKNAGASNFNKAQLLSNRLLAIQSIEEEAYKKYGRILNPHHSFQDKSHLSKQFLNNLFHHKAHADNTHSVKVSVIIPVYNVEKYIQSFLDSLAAQKSEELEFIFVDDCGTDDSMKIVEEYSKRDSRVRIIRNSANIGPGPSRNRGIEIARGEYLAFADSDDRVAPNCYERMYRKAVREKVDVVKGEVRAFNEQGDDITAEKKHFANSTIKRKIEDGLPLHLALTYSHQTMIFSKKFLDDNAIRYGDTMTGEDGLFLLRVFLKAKKLSFYDKTSYLYTIRPSGLSGISSLERQLASLESLSERIMLLKAKGFTDDDYSYIVGYAKCCLHSFKDYYIKHNEKDDLVSYLERFEQAISNVDDSARILNHLPDYEFFKQQLP